MAPYIDLDAVGRREGLEIWRVKYYRLPGLVQLCLDNTFRKGDIVRWKKSAVESYWEFLLTFWSNKEEPRDVCDPCQNWEHTVQYDRPILEEGERLSDLMRGLDNPVPRRRDQFLKFINSLHLKYHMFSAKGEILSVDGAFCIVEWEKQKEPSRVPRAALRLADKNYL